MRAIADSWEFSTDVEVYRFGVPHIKAEHGYEYCLEGLVSLKEYLEHLTGTEITESVLREEIDVANRIRNLLTEISLTRRNNPPLTSGTEYVELIDQSYFI